MKRLAIALLLIGFLGGAVPAAAADLGFQGIALRYGDGRAPNVGIVAIELDLGEILPNLNLEPGIEIGDGSGLVVLALSVPVRYRVAISDQIKAYLGAGVLAAYLEPDDAFLNTEIDGSTFDAAPQIQLGIELYLDDNALRRVGLELAASTGEMSDLRAFFTLSF